ncbi:MAG TPA: class I SAM-dependent methyltransferase [Steroidobacteraceae bacterium]|nr:class I SAM-dependent methyltransferase [Steroidobacteraceae bacterium]
MDSVQAVQESEYAFPYHYLPRVERGSFRWWPYWSWGYKYLAGIEVVLDAIRKRPMTSLVDVGCGDGRFLREVASRYPGARLLGVDHSDGAIHLARALNPQLQYCALDITAAGSIGTFDFVTLIEVLEHVPPAGLANFVSALRGLMHQGSVLIVTVPHRNQALIPKHYQHFDRTSLQHAFGNGFEFESVFFFDMRSAIVRLWERVLFNKYFVVRHQRLLDFMYRRYLEKYLHCDESACLRMGAIVRRSPQ